MSITRLASISTDGTLRAYRGREKQFDVEFEPGTLSPEYIEYVRKYPLASLKH